MKKSVQMAVDLMKFVHLHLKLAFCHVHMVQVSLHVDKHKRLVFVHLEHLVKYKLSMVLVLKNQNVSCIIITSRTSVSVKQVQSVDQVVVKLVTVHLENVHLKRFFQMRLTSRTQFACSRST